ncbi:MAG: hypothetical protein FJ255_05880 [Phycisphaerae bacterium]|nr:hypothetical protein [Phycisphaerae bacterium]
MAHAATDRPRPRLSPARRALFAAAALALAAILILVAGDVGLRVLGWVPPGWYDADGRGPLGVHTADRDGGTLLGHAGPGYFWTRDFKVRSSINSIGLAEVEPTPKEPGEYRVGLLGDSFTFGYGVSQSSRFGDVFQGLARGARPDAEFTIVNMRCPSSAAAHQADLLTGVGARYDVDEVVHVFFSGNDLDDNAFWRSRLADIRAGKADPVPSALYGLLVRNTRIVPFVAARAEFILRSRQLSAASPTARLNAAWDDTRAGLDALLQAAAGRPLTIWYLPEQFEWSDSAWAALKSASGATEDERHAIRARVAQWCAHHAVTMIDLTVPFAGADPAAVLLQGDSHWNQAGHEVAARYLAGQADSIARFRTPR